MAERRPEMSKQDLANIISTGHSSPNIRKRTFLLIARAKAGPSLSSKKLIVECDGHQFHEDKEQAARDRSRIRRAAAGYPILRLPARATGSESSKMRAGACALKQTCGRLMARIKQSNRSFRRIVERLVRDAAACCSFGFSPLLDDAVGGLVRPPNARAFSIHDDAKDAQMARMDKLEQNDKASVRSWVSCVKSLSGWTIRSVTTVSPSIFPYRD